MIPITLAQINPCVGDITGNMQCILTEIKKAQRAGTRIIAFPELSVCGYPPEDLLLKPAFIADCQKAVTKIIKTTIGITALIGFPHEKNGRLYNACAIARNGKIAGIYHKNYLPNYGVFDEKRYFTAGNTPGIYTLGSYRFAVSICEDIWIPHYVSALKKQHISAIFNISASPFHIGKITERIRILTRAACATGAYVFYCNIVGGQDELVFDGTSAVIAPTGTLLCRAKSFARDTLYCSARDKAHSTAHGLRHDDTASVSIPEEQTIFEALSLGIHDYVHKNNFNKVIIGVSGGIDSAVVTSMAVAALGKKSVHGLIMPSRYNSRATHADAIRVCKNLGITHTVVPIDILMRSYRKTLSGVFKNIHAHKTEENLQARIRGNLLMAFSNNLGYLVLNTGNKSEVSCGYCTLYGDMVGGMSVLKDLSKEMVYRLARHINRTMGAPIPLSAIERAPSAELRPHQKDSDFLPPYPTLDPILQLYIERHKTPAEIHAHGFAKKTIASIVRMVDTCEYKRRQAPIGIKITPVSFGKDRRMPITNRYKPAQTHCFI